MSMLSRRRKYLLIRGVGLYGVLFFLGFGLWTSIEIVVMKYTADIQMSTEDDQSGKKETHPNVANKVRILCWIMTSPRNVHARAVHIAMTWGRRCDKTLYISSKADKEFPVISLSVREGRRHLTEKSHKAFRYIYKHFKSNYDWFLKADDDTYVVVENLRHFLSDKNKSSPIYFGQKFNAVIEGGYASGGAGYVLSHEALERLATDGRRSDTCRQDGGAEDVEIGVCLHNLGVELGMSYDIEGKSLFHCFNPASHLLGLFPKWYRSYSEDGNKMGSWTISKRVISFHYVKPDLMYILDFFLYQAAIDLSFKSNH